MPLKKVNFISSVKVGEFFVLVSDYPIQPFGLDVLSGTLTRYDKDSELVYFYCQELQRAICISIEEHITVEIHKQT